MKKTHEEVVGNFANRLESAVDPQDMAAVCDDVELLQKLVSAVVVVEKAVEELRAYINSEDE